MIPGLARFSLHRMRGRRGPLASLALLALLYASAIFAGFLSPYGPRTAFRSVNAHPPMLGRIHVRDAEGRLVRPYVRGILSGALPGDYAEDPATAYPIRLLARGDRWTLLGVLASDRHLIGVDAPGKLFLLGTDELGRDVLSRLVHGGRVSLSVGLLGVAIAVPIGMLVGGVAGLVGGWTDFVLMRLVEILLSVPAIYLVLALRFSFGRATDLTSAEIYLLVVAVLALVGWASLARVVRGMALSLREREFVLAAKAAGRTDLGIVVRHVLPNTLPYVIVATTLAIPGYILGEVALSFLGLGIQEPDASWGLMLRDASALTSLTRFPWLVAPGVLVFATVLAFNVLGDGLREAADPRAVRAR